jgi:CBS domain-containing membrane protein
LLFSPILAGASLRDRIVACAGALLGVAATGAVAHAFAPAAGGLPLLIAPIGASAVLLFAVPASPLAQPWSIVGGNMVSAAVGLAVAHLVPQPGLAAGLAVAAAILAMSLLRCLHPPGGAVALSAVIGGPAVLAAGALFPFVPVAANSLLLVLTGWLFHRISGHSYPHRASAPAGAVVAPAPDLLAEDIDRALHDLGETLDVSREDLELLLRQAEVHAARRRDALATRGPRIEAAAGRLRDAA